MRITNGMLSSNTLNNLNNSLQRLTKYHTQAASGKRLLKLSDDPVGIITSMSARAKLTRISQYQKSVKSAREFLTQVETSVMEMNSVVAKAYETAVNLANDFMTDDDKRAAGELIGQLRDHILALGNSTIVDTHIFGGYTTKSAPFSVDPATGAILYNGMDLTDSTNPDLIAAAGQNIEFEIGLGMRMEVSFTGAELMGIGGDNIYSVMEGLYEVLKNDGSPEEASVFVEKLQAAQSHLLSIAAEVGGRTNRLDLVAGRYEEDTLNYTKMKSDVEDVDEAEAILQYQMARTVYNYALQMGANILSTSLLDFLR